MRRKSIQAVFIFIVVLCILILFSRLRTEIMPNEKYQPPTPSVAAEAPDGASPSPTPSVAEEAPDGASPSPTPSIIPEPKVDYVSSVSPNGLYRGENYGIVTSITAGGQYPAEGIRVVEISSGKTLWDMTPGYYACSFLWSGDSRTLAVSYMARIYGNVVLVSVEDGKEILLSIPKEIQEKMREYRPDPYFVAEEWVDNSKVRVSFKFDGKDEKLYVGTYCFSPRTDEISDFEMDDGTP